MNPIRVIIAVLFLFIGLFTVIVSVIGIYKFKYVLNRMHAAAMCDTMGLLFTGIGIAILYGISLTTLKILLIIVFLWIASPVSSHLIARLEVTTNPEEVEKNCKKEEQ